MVFQDLALWLHMIVGEHLEFVMRKDRMAETNIKDEMGKFIENVCLEQLHGR